MWALRDDASRALADEEADEEAAALSRVLLELAPGDARLRGGNR